MVSCLGTSIHHINRAVSPLPALMPISSHLPPPKKTPKTIPTLAVAWRILLNLFDDQSNTCKYPVDSDVSTEEFSPSSVTISGYLRSSSELQKRSSSRPMEVSDWLKWQFHQCASTSTSASPSLCLSAPATCHLPQPP